MKPTSDWMPSKTFSYDSVYGSKVSFITFEMLDEAEEMKGMEAKGSKSQSREEEEAMNERKGG